MHLASQLLLRQRAPFEAPGTWLVAPPADALLGALPQASALFDDFAAFRPWRDRAGVHFGMLPPEGFAAERAVIFMPKAQALLDWWLRAVCAHLPAGAEVFLVGQNDGGIRGGAKRFAAALGSADKLDSARHCQLWRARLASPAPRPALAEVERRFELALPGGPLQLLTLPGTFSADGLDAGTALLLQTLAETGAPAGRLLDFGCGCGVIGAALKRARPEARVAMLDASASALESARRTLELNGIEAELLASDGFSELSGHFNAIFSNPPFHQGVRADFRVVEALMRQAREFLLPGGELRLVANSFLKYAPVLEQVFGAVEVLADNGRFRVYRCLRQVRP